MNIVTSTSNMTHSNGAPHDPGFFQRIMTAISGVRQKAGDIGRDIIEHPGESALSVMRRVSQARETVGDVGHSIIERPGEIIEALSPVASGQDVIQGGKEFLLEGKNQGLPLMLSGLLEFTPGGRGRRIGKELSEEALSSVMRQNRRSAQRLGMGDGPSGIRAPEGSEIVERQTERILRRRPGTATVEIRDPIHIRELPSGAQRPTAMFRAINVDGELVPGTIRAELLDNGILDVGLPTFTKGQHKLGPRGIRDVGRRVIELFEAQGHPISTIQGFRATGARTGPASLMTLEALDDADQILSIPRSFFIPE